MLKKVEKGWSTDMLYEFMMLCSVGICSFEPTNHVGFVLMVNIFSHSTDVMSTVCNKQINKGVIRAMAVLEGQMHKLLEQWFSTFLRPGPANNSTFFHAPTVKQKSLFSNNKSMRMHNMY